MAITIKEIMLPEPLTLRVEQTTATAREMMVFSGYDCLCVVDSERRPVGIATVLQLSANTKARKLQKVMDTSFPRVGQDQAVRDAATIFSGKDFDYPVLPVVDAEGRLVGILRLRDLVKDLTAPAAPDARMAPEALVVQLAMTHSEPEEHEWVEKIRGHGFQAAVTQVGTTAEHLPVKLREASVVAAMAHHVISEDPREKVAVSYAARDIVLQMEMISPGLGGGFKLGIVRGDGRIAICACGRSGHALVSSSEQIFLGTSTI